MAQLLIETFCTKEMTYLSPIQTKNIKNLHKNLTRIMNLTFQIENDCNFNKPKFQQL